MGVVLTLGIVLILLGITINAGLMQSIGIFLTIGGVAAAIAGAAALFFGNGSTKLWGLGLLLLGTGVSVMGAIMQFVFDLWIIHWLINFGSYLMLIIGIITAAIGLIGLLKGSGQKRYSPANRSINRRINR